MPERREGAVLLKSGQSVSLYVRSVNPDGTARIQVAGADIAARSESPARLPLQAGAVLKGTVFFEGGKVYIKVNSPPQPGASPFSSFLASSGISPSDAAFHVLSFFYASGIRLEPSAIRRILQLALAFPQKELRACEAASLLYLRGLPLTEGNLRVALAALEGRLPAGAEGGILPLNADAGRGKGSSAGEEMQGGKGQGEEGLYESEKGGQAPESRLRYAANDEDSQSLDFFSALAGWDAGKSAGQLEWRIIPFRRSFGKTECTGSIRFLADRAGGSALETRVTAVLEDGSSADFVIYQGQGGREGGCRFSVLPSPSSKSLPRLSAELAKELRNAGLPFPVEYGFGENVSCARPVNLYG